MISRRALIVLMAMGLLLTGCRTLALFADPPTRTVVAEYPYLANKRVCIVVHADDEIRFTYPHVQWEVADHVRSSLDQHIQGIDVVEPRKVVDFQNREYNWDTMDPALIGQRFGAARVLEITLTQYTTREPESPHLYRGHIAAAIAVYNADYPNSQPAYRTDVKVTYPPDGPGAWGTSDSEIRFATMEAFAQELSGKFYDRKVKK